MPESRRSRTRTLPPNDQKATDQPDTTGQEPPTEAEVVAGVTHYHGGERDFHRHGLDPHHHIDGHLVDGAWVPDGVKLWEYVGIADVNEHRHDDRFTHSHADFGQQEHFHNPPNNAILPLPADGWPVEYQPRQEPADLQAAGSGTAHLPAENPSVEVTPGATYTAEGQASQTRHPSGHDPADDGLPNPAELNPEQREQLKAYHNRSLSHLDGSSPAAPAVPIREGASRVGTSVAHPGALNLLNTVHHVTDDALNHEMTWVTILAPLVIEMATYHADDRAEGGSGPELAPLELITQARDALEQIRLPRLAALDAAREAQP
jgi:hypothetical protein